MAFNLSNWLLRRRIDAQARTSGRPIEHSRVGNPYHAVSVLAGPQCCAAARELDGRRFLSSGAPMLPLKACTQSICQCRYVHHSDRRSSGDRRMRIHNPHAHKMADRRTGNGRRLND